MLKHINSDHVIGVYLFVHVCVCVCRCSILSGLSYVSLGLGDPVSALSYSQQLRATPNLPTGLLYLSKLYSAQALVLLQKVPEAMQLLTPDSIKDVGFTGQPHPHYQTISISVHSYP